MRISVVVIGVLLVLSCSKKKENCPIPKEENKFQMYKMSEMALLMEQMYADNERLKQRISNGEKIGEFPQHFLKIHKAVMTDKQENDAFFKEHAKAYIASQQLIYSDPENAKEHFNEGVDQCVACHEVKCGGPIVRIKKLYIK